MNSLVCILVNLKHDTVFRLSFKIAVQQRNYEMTGVKNGDALCAGKTEIDDQSKDIFVKQLETS